MGAGALVLSLLSQFVPSSSVCWLVMCQLDTSSVRQGAAPVDVRGPVLPPEAIRVDVYHPCYCGGPGLGWSY